MAYHRHYSADEPARQAVDSLPGPTLLEFGTDWCGHCQAAQPAIAAALGAHPDIRHLKIEDGRGRLLGRSYRIKLWPTLVCLSDGEEIARVVRPQDRESIDVALQAIDPAEQPGES